MTLVAGRHFLARRLYETDARTMIEVRALPQLEVREWSRVVRVRLERTSGARGATAMVVVLGTATAILAAILALG